MIKKTYIFLLLGVLAACSSEEDGGSKGECAQDAECVGKVSGLTSCEEVACVSAVCGKKNKAAQSVCDDGDSNACTTGACSSSGQCVSSTKNCNDNNVCTSDSCNSATGNCVNTATTLSVACDDNNTCTSGTTCSEGVCGGGSNTCNCTTDADCSSQLASQVCKNKVCSSGTCVYQNQTAGTSCDDADGDACTLGACNASASCESTAKNCDDNNRCTTDSCNGSSGACSHASVFSGDASIVWTSARSLTCSGGSCHGTGGASMSSDSNALNRVNNGSMPPGRGCNHPTDFAANNTGNCLTLGEYCALKSLAP
jgi:hypothetical protein